MDNPAHAYELDRDTSLLLLGDGLDLVHHFGDFRVAGDLVKPPWTARADLASARLVRTGNPYLAVFLTRAPLLRRSQVIELADARTNGVGERLYFPSSRISCCTPMCASITSSLWWRGMRSAAA